MLPRKLAIKTDKSIMLKLEMQKFQKVKKIKYIKKVVLKSLKMMQKWVEKVKKKTTYSGCVEVEVSTVTIQTGKGEVKINKNGGKLKGNYEEKIHGKVYATISTTKLGVNTEASRNTYRDAKVKVDKNCVKVGAKVGREYGEKGNGKEVAKVDGKIKGEVGG